jgi:Fur family ferric uptake transcriptional regulator
VQVRTVRKNAALSEETLQRALEKFRAALRTRALKMTSVREAIVRAALTYDGHFGVDELLATLATRGVSEAHMTTVYRTLPLLVETGLVQPALLTRREGQRYEAAFEREHHDHLICSHCGKVVEFQSEAIEALQREIASRHGFELTEHVHELVGRCSACRRGHHG